MWRSGVLEVIWCVLSYYVGYARLYGEWYENGRSGEMGIQLRVAGLSDQSLLAELGVA